MTSAQRKAVVERLDRHRTALVLGVLALGMIGLFLLDVSTPPGVADGVGYPVLLVLCLWLPQRWILSACTWASTLLAIAGAAFATEGGVGLEASLINRALGIAAIWIIYFLLLQRAGLEDRLRESERKALAASQAKSNFLANMSHQLRTPLNAIVGFSELVAKEAFGPVGNSKYREYADHIHMSGTQLLVLIGDILDISKIESGKYRLEEQYVDLPALIDGISGMMQARALEAGLTLKLAVRATPAHVRADPRALKLILVNLLSNAIKFTREGGRITVSAGLLPDHVFIAVADTGIGIPKADLARLAAPFEQGDHASVRTRSGIGLGLALCRRLAELHDGRLEISSVVDKGTTVRILLPRSRLFPAEVRSADEPHAASVQAPVGALPGNRA
jgi:signal transduction histidine kinase